MRQDATGPDVEQERQNKRETNQSDGGPGSVISNTSFMTTDGCILLSISKQIPPFIRHRLIAPACLSHHKLVRESHHVHCPWVLLVLVLVLFYD